MSGVQCVDLIKHYCYNVLGINKRFSDAWGNAIEWFTKFDSKPWLTENFQKIPYKQGMKILKGDIAVFKTSSPYGHIAVCTGYQDANGFTAYDQNYNGSGSGMTERYFNYSGQRELLGVLRPKSHKNIDGLKPYGNGTVVKKCAVYSSSLMTDKVGTLFKNDRALKLCTAGGNPVVIYPITKGYKVGVIKKECFKED